MGTDSGYVEHLEELRWKIIISLVFFCVVFILGFTFIDKIVLFLQEPIAGYNLKLYYFKPHEKFMAYIKVDLILTILVSLPFLIWQLGLFIWPALKKEEKRSVFLSLILIPIIFFIGSIFAYKFIAPIAFKFFITFSSGDNVIPMWSFGEYFDMLLSLVIMSGVVFQFPLILVVLINMGIVEVSTLEKYRKVIIIVIAVAAGIFSPGPDILSQIMIGIPMYLLFEGAVLAGKIIMKRKVGKTEN